MKMDKEKAQKKEDQYNNIIQLLQKQAEENAKEGKNKEIGNNSSSLNTSVDV